MKKIINIKYIKVLLSIVLLLNSSSLISQKQYSIREVPNVQRNNYEKFVSDPSNQINYTDKETLNDKLLELRKTQDVQAAIVVLPDIDNQYESAKAFASELFSYWGIGDKERNNGLLILLLTADDKREIVFETGYGIEDRLNDGTSKLIQTQKMIPYFKDEAYGTGLIAGVNEIDKVLSGVSNLTREPSNSSGSGNMTLPIIIWLMVGIGALMLNENRKKKQIVGASNPFQSAIKQKSSGGLGCVLAVLFFPVFIIYRLFTGRKNKSTNVLIDCPSCHSKDTIKLKKGEPIIKQQAIPGQDGMKAYEFVCSNCGYTHEELMPYKYAKPQSESSSSTTTTYGSNGATRRGSWGGGKSGGGGAATKF